ncbi:ABC transporter permease, partial [Clostridium perfringens]|nr:ABC transporter permease [Clostridium perfringens]
MLPPLMVLKESGLIYLSSIPMAAIYWMLATCIQPPIFSVGIGLATIVPSVLAINTQVWFAYPMCYPFMIITSEMQKMTTNMGTFSYELLPWIPIAIVITVICLTISCIRFGQAE